MRSTSGMTCCHFFCSAVFSMPVWRNPIVGAADRTVSPSSSRTSRSTPCVLGCCGPMLTVMVSVRMSGIKLTPQPREHKGHKGHKGREVQNSFLVTFVPFVSSVLIHSRERPLHHVADDVQHRPVHLLHARRRVR